MVSQTSNVAIGALLVLCILGKAAFIAYRFTLHPLARFNGSSVSVLTPLYESYLVLSGRFAAEIDHLHQKHGNIIRFGRDGLLVRDPEFHPTVYTRKWPTAIRRRARAGTGTEDSIAATRFQSRIEKETDAFMRNLQTQLQGGQVVSLEHMFATFSGNVLTSLSLPFPGELAQPYGSPRWYEDVRHFFRIFTVYMQLPYLRRMIHVVPRQLLNRLYPPLVRYEEIFESFHEQIVAISTRPSTRHIEDNLATFLLHSSLRAVDKTARRVEAEVVSACMGGIGSIALVLTIASFYIMRDPEVKRQLHDCLRALPLDAFTNEFAHVRDLFKSTYLSACGLEALRLGHGTLGCSPRCAGVDLTYRGRKIPKGTAVSVMAGTVHMDGSVFSEPYRFMPERWLVIDALPLHKNLVAFGRGTHDCPAQLLAESIVMYSLARLFHPDGPQMELYDTNEADIIPVHDRVLPMRSDLGRGLRVFQRSI